MFKTSGRASFLIILFQFRQYYVFVVLSGDAFALFHAATALEHKVEERTAALENANKELQEALIKEKELAKKLLKRLLKKTQVYQKASITNC